MRTITVTEKYRAVLEGSMAKSEFVRQMRQSYPMYVSPISDYKSTVQILKNKSLLFEDKKEVDDSFKYSTESLRRAIDIELEAAGLMSHETISGEDQEKARVKAVANLKKDPLHYYHLIAGESKKVDKHDKEKEVKRGALEVDTFNGMKKATLKEAKLMTEGTRALVGYLSGDRLTTTYNHYDGYPSNLGKGLEAHYNNDEAAKDVAMKGYITYMDPETGEIESTHNDSPTKIKLPEEAYEIAKEIAEEINSMGADYGYIWDDQLDKWATIKNTGIRSMVDQITDKLINKPARDMDHAMQGIDPELYETEEEYLAKKDAAIKKAMGNDIEEIDTSLDPYEDKKEIIRQVIQLIKSSMPADNETIKDFIKTHYNDIINLGDDEAILDEFQEFLSVNTYYVDEDLEKEVDGGAELFNKVIQSMGVNSWKDAVEVIEKFEKEFNHNEPVGVKQYQKLIDALERLQDKDTMKHILDAFSYVYYDRGVSNIRFSEAKGKDHDGDGDIDGDDYMHAKDKAIKKAMGKKAVNEDVVVVGHTPEELKKNAEEIAAAAKKAGRNPRITYNPNNGEIDGVDIGAPGLGTPKEVQAIQDRQFDDYDKNMPKDDKPSFKPKKLKKLTVGGKTYEKGDFDPNDDGRIMSIEKYPNGYYIQGGVYSDYGDGDGPKEGYGYAIDLKGNEMDEEDLEGMYENAKAVNELRGSGDDIIEIIKAMAMEMDGDEEEAAMEVMEFIGEHYKIDFEFGRVGGGTYGRRDGAPYEGKVNEAVKNIITKVLEEEILTEAATQELAKIADEYDAFDGLKPAVIALENVVTEIESFYDKTRSKIQKIYNDLGEVRNEEGLKVGAFITPSIENAFKRDLKPIIKNQFHGGLDLPQVKRISQADVDKGYIQQEAPKETVFTPVNEKKNKNGK